MNTKKNLVILLLLMNVLNVFAQNSKTKTSSKSSSTSICEGNNEYTFSANFSDDDVDFVKKIIEKQFGISKNGLWEKQEIYSIKLKSSGKLNITLDKEQANNALINKIIKMGAEINDFISGSDTPIPPSPPSRD
jgi:hypothetical protein